MVSYAAVRSRKTASVFSVFLNPLSMNVMRAMTWSQVVRPRCKPDRLTLRRYVHGWGDSLQDGAFQQLVTYTQG